MNNPRAGLLLATLTLAGLLLTACEQGGDAPSEQPAVRGDEVRVVDNDFEPANLEVTAGETVTWTWEGGTDHNVVGDGFDSGVQREGTFEHTFDEAGSYDYACTLHRGMSGRITVTAP